MGERATYADLEAAPEDLTAEILGGELHLSPHPGNRVVHVWSEMLADIGIAFGRTRGGDGPGGWSILFRPELHLGAVDPRDTVTVPALVGWRRERVASDVPRYDLLPDWVGEILSPGSEHTWRERILKPDIYAARGIPHLWILDPEAQTLEVFRHQGGVYPRVQAFIGDVRVRAVPFDAVELDIGAWWPGESG